MDYSTTNFYGGKIDPSVFSLDRLNSQGKRVTCIGVDNTDTKNKWLSFNSRDSYNKNSTLDFFEKTDKIIFIRTTDDNREIFTLNRFDGTLSVRSSWFNNITEDSVFYKMYKHRKFKYVTTDFYECEKSDRIF